MKKLNGLTSWTPLFENGLLNLLASSDKEKL